MLRFGVSFTALMLPVSVFAQSTGSIDFEDEIVVTGGKIDQGIQGVVIPDAPKTRAILTQELIDTQSSGQTILNTINLIPGVNFTNTDAYGSSGGNIRIRGFDGARISLTFDGMPLNDSGNYAIFSNQQLDPELIDQVNVNLGTTDVDSPTASAAGGTVNIRSITPTEKLGAYLKASVGEDDYRRVLGVFNSGELTSFGTKLWLSASTSRNQKFKGPGEIDKQQYNGKIYQPIGGNGDFISIAGHYNQNRNNFYRNVATTDVALNGLTSGIAQIAGTRTPALPLTTSGRTTIVADNVTRVINPAAGYAFENLATCALDAPTAGVADNDNAGGGANANNPLFTTSCSNFFGVRINPSNTGNIRINSKFSLAENVTLTVDPSFQYVLANGGGSTTLAENSAVVRGNSGLLGKDLNGDGDILDTIRFYTPNTTNTRRYGLTASLIWDISEDHRIRFAYSYDRARHRQTGQWGFLGGDGNPENVFGGLKSRAVTSADGVDLRQRDRLSIALLNQFAGEYRGKFFDSKLVVNLGLRLPYFQRDLENFCYTQTGGSGFATCTSQPVSALVIVAPNATVFPAGALFAPFKAKYKFNELLPNVGAVYKITDNASVFGSYAKGLSSPRTDNLYRAPVVKVDPETTDSFDLGLRYNSSRVQVQVAGWYQSFKNRIVTSFDQERAISLDRNIGSVTQKGVDVSLSVKPAKFVDLYLFTSYIDSKIKDDILLGSGTVGAIVTQVFVDTSGKKIPETPTWQYGGRVGVHFGPVSAALQGKYVGSRFATDLNDVKVPSYFLADLDARVSLEDYGLEKTYIQVNVSNLFNKKYIGNINTQISNAANFGTNPNFAVGSPRTISGTIRVGF
jgi:iron complex outermembrane recepter protein